MQEDKERALFSSSKRATLAMQIAQAALKKLPEDKLRLYGGLWLQYELKGLKPVINLDPDPRGYKFDIYVAAVDSDLEEVRYPKGNRVRVECKERWRGRWEVEVYFVLGEGRSQAQFHFSFDANLSASTICLETRWF